MRVCMGTPRVNSLPHSSYSSYCENNSANLLTSAKNKKELLFFSMFLPGVFLSGLLRLHEEEDEGSGALQVHCLVLLLSGLRLRLGGVYLRDRAHDGLGGACLGDCAHPEDHEEEAEGMED